MKGSAEEGMVPDPSDAVTRLSRMANLSSGVPQTVNMGNEE